jgi:DNA-binding MarR family transcriptional regulator
LDRREPLTELLRRAVRELGRLESAGLSRTRARLRPGQVPILTALLEASPLTASELCARCDAEPSTMTGVLRTLEAGGLVTREKVVQDQRRQAVSLTARGRVAARAAAKARARAESKVLASLSRADAATAQRLLTMLADGAQALAADADDSRTE